MASESPERSPVPVTLPPSLDEWLAERADAAGVDRGELLVQLAATYRAAAEDGDAASELVSAVEGTATDAATERVDDRLGSFRSSLDSQLQAIRKRIVQLKHEVDERADASRVNELSTRVDGLDERLDGLEGTVGTLRTELETRPRVLEDEETSTGRTDEHHGGHDGSVVDPELVERLDDVESKLVRLARAVVGLREGGVPAGDGDVPGAPDIGESRGTTLRELKRTAVREGVRDARCAGCGGSVDLALLPDATCPYCDVRFHRLTTDPGSGEPRLGVGDGVGSDDEPGEGTPADGPDADTGADDR
ncbi:MAG: hypothetical protein V5A62_07915 [Haloarculaceae archaeon]